MVDATIRTHVIFPRRVIAEIDRIAGKRHRSQFITNAIEEKLTREAQLRAFDATFGALKDADYPEWDTPEKISAWVSELREESDRSMEDKLTNTGT